MKKSKIPFEEWKQAQIERYGGDILLFPDLDPEIQGGCAAISLFPSLEDRLLKK